jgi:carbon storage regulator
MLVLSRKNREAVVIGGTDGLHRLFKVTVLAINGTNVKLGFEIDSDVPVHRAEVWERIQAGRLIDSLTEDSITLGIRCVEQEAIRLSQLALETSSARFGHD